MYSSSLLISPCAMFFVFPDGGFSTDFWEPPLDFRPPVFEEVEEGRLAAELGREAFDCNEKSYAKLRRLYISPKIHLKFLKSFSKRKFVTICKGNTKNAKLSRDHRHDSLHLNPVHWQ